MKTITLLAIALLIPSISYAKGGQTIFQTYTGSNLNKQMGSLKEQGVIRGDTQVIYLIIPRKSSDHHPLKVGREETVLVGMNFIQSLDKVEASPIFDSLFSGVTLEAKPTFNPDGSGVLDISMAVSKTVGYISGIKHKKYSLVKPMVEIQRFTAIMKKDLNFVVMVFEPKGFKQAVVVIELEPVITELKPVIIEIDVK